MDADEENISPRSRGLHEQAQTRIESVPVGAKRRGTRPKSSDDEATVLHSMSLHPPPPHEATPKATSGRPVVRTPDGTRVLDPAVLAGQAGREPAARTPGDAQQPQGNYEPTRVIGQDEIGGRERSEGISLLAAQARGGVEPVDTVVTRASVRESSSEDEATRVGAMADLLAAGRRKAKRTAADVAPEPARVRQPEVAPRSPPPSAVPTEAHLPYHSSAPPSSVPTGAHPPIRSGMPSAGPSSAPSSVPTGAHPPVAAGFAPPPSAVPTGGFPTVPSAGHATGGYASVPASPARPAPGRRPRSGNRPAPRSGVLAPVDSALEENRRLAWGFFVGILIAIAFMAAVFAIVRVLMG